MLAFPRRHAAQIAREEVDEGANLTCQVECGAMPSPATAASRNSSPWLLRPTVATVPIVCATRRSYETTWVPSDGR